MNQKSKVMKLVLFVIWAFLLSNVSLGISSAEIQKIEKAVPTKATVRPQRPRKLLVFNRGRGYVHSAIAYGAKAIEIMGKKTGAFEVVHSEDASAFEPENLRQFDAVCLNNCNRMDFFRDASLRRSLLNFVKSGKGLVGIHAATTNFSSKPPIGSVDWPQAAEMIGGVFVGHPWAAGGTWAVKIDKPNHPLAAAFKGQGFKISDEIYLTRFADLGSLQVLLSLDFSDQATRRADPKADNVPISWIRTYGKGRVFYCSLGHNHHVFWNPAILKHYLDGIQYALGDLQVGAQPDILDLESLEDILRQLAGYDYGRSRKPLADLDSFLRKSYSPGQLSRIEKHLLEFLRSNASLAARQFICRKLRIIGSEQSVPTLAAMLTDKATSDMARYALETIPGSAVDEALRDALGKTSGKIRIGIINSLGRRGDTGSIAALRKLLYKYGPTMNIAAATALGRIADSRAIAALAEAKDKTEGKLRVAVLDAYLKCADKLAAEGRRRQALAIYEKLHAPGEPQLIRIAALRGIASVKGDRAIRTVVEEIKGPDGLVQAAAIGLVKEMPGTKIVKAASAELANLSITGQVRLMSALAERGDPAALPAVTRATKSSRSEVRIAALNALALLGNSSTVELLAQTAANTTGAEGRAARDSLYRLRGPEVDQTILGSIAQADARTKVELIRSVGQRNIAAGAEVLLRTAKDPEGSVRAESIKVLRDIAGPQHISALVDVLTGSERRTELREAERTLVSVLNKAKDKNAGVSRVLAVLPSIEDVEGRCALLRVLGKTATGSALEALRSALEDSNTEVQATAIRVLSEWPDPEPAKDLLKVARSSESRTHRILALRGFVHMLELPSTRPADQTKNMYKAAVKICDRSEEKKMVLAGLSRVAQPWALELVEPYLADESVKTEAEAAYQAISTLLGRPVVVTARAVLKAKNAKIHGPGATYETGSGRDCIGMWNNANAWVSWDIEIKQPGVFAVEVSQSMAGQAGSEYVVAIGDKQLKAVVKDTGDWARFITEQLGEVEIVKPGTYTVAVKVTRKEKTFVMNLRSVTLRRLSPSEISAARQRSKTAKAGGKIYLTGEDFSAWRQGTGTWQIAGNAFSNPQNDRSLAGSAGSGVMINGPKGVTSHLFSRRDFGDVKAHVEFMVSKGSNSGVYFMGRYEIQILDSWGKERPNFDDCGGIYQRWDENRQPRGFEGHPPRVNASRPPGQWQSYDVVFRAPRFDKGGRKIANARFEKVIHNGTVVHENVEVTGPTRASAYQDEKAKGPLMLQGDHGPVAYRNIWLIELPEKSKD